MPLLDIATSQPYFGNYICASRAQIFINGSTQRKNNFIKVEKLSTTWKLSTPRKVNFNVGHPNRRNALLITAVSTLEQKHVSQNENGSNDDHRFLFDSDPDSNSKMFNSLSESSSEIDEKEKLRRMRISNANKGNVPWNKGRKHSAETLRRIKERTRLAMQDPKVKMKLVNLGHAQSEETRIKIGVGVRKGWKRRRAKLLVQETCCFEWQNLIAEASRRGYRGEEELQWDSYKILDKQLQQEWLESIERRKSMPRTKGNKRAPKSPEQRRKISEAISAKWNDPEYRERVCSALEKYHGTPVGTQKRRPRRNPSENSELSRSRVKKKINADAGNERKSQARPRPKRSAPKYKDPLADSKLEMIKNIRAQRMAMETKKIEAMERARLLITEAEMAAKTLEEAALTNPLARASLIETRKLIAEATRSIEAVETGHITSYEKDSYSSSKFNGQVNSFGEETDSGNGDDTPPNMKEPNGIHVPFLQNNGVEDLDLGKTSVQDLINQEHHEQTRNDGNSSSLFQSNALINQISLKDEQISQFEANGAIRNGRAEVPNNGEKTVLLLNGAGQTLETTNPTKKWVCGRLVEVSDSASENGKTLGQE